MTSHHIRYSEITTIIMTSPDLSKKDFPLQGLTDDYWSNETEASATCFCGKVQMAVVS